MIYFTSDWHLGEKRLGINQTPNLFYRPFKSTEENDFTIVNNFLNSGFENGDTLYFLGDMFFEVNDYNLHLFRKIKEKFPKSVFNLIIGNYDTEDKMQVLAQLFNNVFHDKELKISGQNYYLNHYPSEVQAFIVEYSEYKDKGITGHIHSLWKVQKDVINVGVDAWHFRPVSQDEIEFCFNAMENHYDNNVFL